MERRSNLTKEEVASWKEEVKDVFTNITTKKGVTVKESEFIFKVTREDKIVEFVKESTYEFKTVADALIELGEKKALKFLDNGYKNYRKNIVTNIVWSNKLDAVAEWKATTGPKTKKALILILNEDQRHEVSSYLMENGSIKEILEFRTLIDVEEEDLAEEDQD